MLSNSRSASPAFPSTPSSPRPKLPFLPLGGIRRGLDGHGAHDGPRSGRPPPRPGLPPCRGATWPGTHPGTDRGPATWWLQPTGLVRYRPVNTKINITLHFLLGKNTLTLWCIERSFFGLIQVCGFYCTNGEGGHSTHSGRSVFRPLLTTELCDVGCVWCCMAFDLCVWS